MDRTTDPSRSDRRTTSPDRSCPLCGDQLRESQYPRHRITLADESEVAPNQLVNRRLCRDCWETIYIGLAGAD